MKIDRRIAGFALIGALIVAVVSIALYKTFQPVHRSAKAQTTTTTTQSSKCVTLSSGTSVCENNPAIKSLAHTLLSCVSQLGGTRTAATQCVNAMLSSFKSQGASTQDAEAIASLVIARAAGK